MNPLLVLLAAMAMDAVIGEGGPLFRLIPHPITLVGRAVTVLERRLNRPQRSEAVRRWRGVLVLLVVAGGAAMLGWLIQDLAVNALGAWPVTVLTTWTLIAQRSLSDHVLAVANALDIAGLPAGRVAVGHIVGRDVGGLDEAGVSRAAIESCAENFSDGVVAPIFWFVIAGLPGMAAYKAINTLDSMIGHLSPQYRAFGWASARMDDLVNLIPARLSGVLIGIAALWVKTTQVRPAFVTMFRDAGKHKSPNAGWPEAAMAGALGLSLGGPRAYPGVIVDGAWLGTGRGRCNSGDIRRSVRVLWTAGGLLAGLVAVLWWVQG